MLGLDNAGKTTVCKKILGEDTSEIAPTLGFNIHTVEHNGYWRDCKFSLFFDNFNILFKNFYDFFHKKGSKFFDFLFENRSCDLNSFIISKNSL